MVDTGMLVVATIAVLISAFAQVLNVWHIRLQTDPEVIIFVTPDEDEETLMWIVVQNVGKGLATDISFIWRTAHPVKAYGLTSDEAIRKSFRTDGRTTSTRHPIARPRLAVCFQLGSIRRHHPRSCPAWRGTQGRV
jgi:hypothetical protein